MLNTDHNSKFLPEALTFDDILMVPAHSNVLPADINVRTRLAGDIYLNTPHGHRHGPGRRPRRHP